MSKTPEQIEAEVKAGVRVHPALDWHDIGCIKRYGGACDAPCACEMRRDAGVKQ